MKVSCVSNLIMCVCCCLVGVKVSGCVVICFMVNVRCFGLILWSGLKICVCLFIIWSGLVISMS